MEKKFRLLLLLALLMTAATGAWAEEQVVYTLDGTQTASNTAYANAGVVNQGGITWMVTGNVNQNPWRIGGKDLSGVDRPVWSENSLDETVTKVTLEFGEANSITVNSITMTVAGDADFNNVIDSKAVNFSANNTVDVTPTEGKEWTNAYYRFVFNVSVSGSTNRFVQLKSIKFYNDPDAQQQGGSTEPVAGTFTVSMKGDVKDADKWTVKVGEGQAQALPIGGLKGDGSETVTLTYTGRLKVKGVKATSDAAPAPSVPDGALSGVFSVSSTKKVNFSKGNLRYASSKWSFFDNQYDYYTSQSADAWDKFGWSTSATTYGMHTSDYNSAYSGDFVDWGETMDTGWFTLSSDEWKYLINTRSASTVNGTENGRFAKAKVNDVGGVIIFPDTYTHPDGVTAPTNVNTTNASFDSNTYTVADWTKMESAGCVFLPAAGYREGSLVSDPGTYGNYWSATPDGTNRANRMFFTSGALNPAMAFARYNGCSVRLVREVTTSDEEPAGPLDNTTTAWADGSTYAVPAGGLTYSDAITVSGDVTLVLTDGETLTLNKGISLAEGATLTVEGEGTMNVNGTNGNTSSTVAGSGTLLLTSGTLNATGGNGADAVGTGSGITANAGGVAINGAVTVSGGTLTATGGNGGSITGNWRLNCKGGAGGAAISGALTINGGTVTTTNGTNGSVGSGCFDCTAGAGGAAAAGGVTDNR